MSCLLTMNVRKFCFIVARISNQHQDRKSTRLNSSHSQISYAVFCLKKKTKTYTPSLCSLPGRFGCPVTTVLVCGSPTSRRFSTRLVAFRLRYTCSYLLHPALPMDPV